MKHTVRLFSILALTALCCVSTARAGDDVESHYIRNAYNRYFPMESSARSRDMGGVFTALKGDSISVWGNPAGLAAVDRALVSLGYQYELIDGDNLSTGSSADENIYGGLLLGAVPLCNEAVLGVGFVPRFSDWDDVDSREADHYYVPVSLSVKINDQLAVGYGIGYINDKVDGKLYDGSMDDGLLHRFGVMYSATENLDLGLMGTYGHGTSDGDTATGFHTSGDREAWGIHGGAALQLNDQWLWALDLSYENLQTDGSVRFTAIPGSPAMTLDEEIDVISVNTGVEFAYSDQLTLRGGAGYANYDYDTTDAAVSSVVNSLDEFHISGGLSYDWTDNINTQTGIQVRFTDVVDMMAGGEITFKF
ncbi:MAG: hypothetical protein GC154_03575 [bacterium]|nr:hypothetical protein [bacterium]